MLGMQREIVKAASRSPAAGDRLGDAANLFQLAAREVCFTRLVICLQHDSSPWCLENPQMTTFIGLVQTHWLEQLRSACCSEKINVFRYIKRDLAGFDGSGWSLSESMLLPDTGSLRS